jgi:16S rRNA (cytidine1402-2'-O)-methyltransferase
MTFRGVRILQSVNLIAAEDTRHTGKLLHHFQINTPQISYHKHNQQQRLPELIAKLQQGKTIALVTDAGMPLISDPGYLLVKACVEAGITVTPIPGATASITALSAAGLPTDRFVFEGFLPTKGKERRQYLERLRTETRTVIFYEAPHRVRETLADFAAVLGTDRQIVLARELTKMHEEFWRGTLAEAIAHHTQKEPQGEYTLVVAGSSPDTPVVTEVVLKQELQALLAEGMTRSQASQHLAQVTSLPRRQIYQLALELDDGQESANERNDGYIMD